MRAVAGALTLLVVGAAPSGAGWTVSTKAAPASVRAAALVPVAAPTVATQCFVGGNISVTITWSPTDAHVGGYEVYRLRDGTATRVADVPAGTHTASDGGSLLSTSLSYYVVSKLSAWRATSPTRAVPTAC